MTEHTPECLREQVAREAWVKQYPNYCQHCGATGEYYILMHVYRDGSADPPDQGPCAACAEQGLCPRCGATDSLIHGQDSEGYDIIEPPCTVCGWQSADDGIPGEGMCICFLEEPSEGVWGLDE